jgi:hypothetical protein
VNSIAVTLVLLVVGVVACAAAGLTSETAPLCDSWTGEMTRAGGVCEGIDFSWLPEGRDYAKLVGLRIAGWIPMVPAGALFFAWLLAGALDRRASSARIPSPAVAFLAKRAFCLGILLGGLSVVAPIDVPVWFGFVPWALLGGSAHVYVANLPQRL